MDAHVTLSWILSWFSAGIAQCGGALSTDGDLITSLFLLGLVGSLSHCVGMCGPFVLAQVSARLDNIPVSHMREWHRLSGAALLPYHLGRATSYASLGAMLAWLFGVIGTETAQMRRISALLLALAAVFFAGYAVKGMRAWGLTLGLPQPGGSAGNRASNRNESWGGRGLVRFSRALAPLFGQPLGWRGYALGVALGFIPCGLLWGALAVAAASGHPLSGLLGMLAFTLGTVPSLVLVALAGHLAGRFARGLLVRVAPLIMAANASALAIMAWRLWYRG